MRRIGLILTVLFVAGPAWADVKLIVERDATDPGKIWIKYESDEAQRIRAFALDITANDGNIIDINDFAVGDNNGGYGIFPGAFRDAPIAVNPTTGQVENWGVTGYSPLAPADDPDARGDIPGPAITVELGSLYTDAPPSQTEGYLCSVTVDGNVSQVCVTGNAIRGNVVLEDASEATTNVDVEPVCLGGCPAGDCFPCDHPDYDEWVAVGKPACWSYARQCRGDADGKKQGSPFLGYMYVGTDDLAVLVDAWKILEPPKGPGIATVENGICADFDHDKQGSPFLGHMRVGTDDLGVLIAHWKVLEAPHGPGVEPDCFGILAP